jgi:hypothetical protein
MLEESKQNNTLADPDPVPDCRREYCLKILFLYQGVRGLTLTKFDFQAKQPKSRARGRVIAHPPPCDFICLKAICQFASVAEFFVAYLRVKPMLSTLIMTS